MRKLPTRKSFGELFKKYRLRAEIETLSEFGDLLAEEGIVYETSLFTRWQNGERVPRDRKTLLKMVKVFVDKLGIKNIYEANQMLESIGERDLNEIEKFEITRLLQKKKNSTLPAKPQQFIGRQKIIKIVTWELINNNNLLIYGFPGVGKTTLALYTAHLLSNIFEDGIFWFRADLKDPMEILDELLNLLGYNSTGVMNLEVKFDKLKLFIKGKKVLIILDNIQSLFFDSEIIKYMMSLSIPILCTSIEDTYTNKIKKVKLVHFSLKEFFILAKSVLGLPYVSVNIKQLNMIGSLLGYLPIASCIILKRIYENPHMINHYLNQIKKKKFNFDDLAYDNKNLYTVMNLVCENLSTDSRKILDSCSLFDGKDFSLDILAILNKQDKDMLEKKLLRLYYLSFIEKSVNLRFRLHPIIKVYLNNNINKKHYVELAKIYINKLESIINQRKLYINFLQNELDNIMPLIDKCYEVKEYLLVITIWSLISKFIFYSDKWYLIYRFDKRIQSAYKRLKDQRGLLIYLVEDLGRIYFYHNKLNKVFKLFSQSEMIAKSLNDNILRALIQQKYGIVYNSLGEFDKSKKYLLESLQYLERSNLKEETVKSYTFLGIAYLSLNNYIKSEFYLQKSLQLSKKFTDSITVGYLYIYLGKLYIKINKFDSAKFFLQKGYKMHNRFHVKVGQAIALQGLGEVYSHLNRSKIAIKKLNQAKDLYIILSMQKYVKSVDGQINELLKTKEK